MHFVLNATQYTRMKTTHLTEVCKGKGEKMKKFITTFLLIIIIMTTLLPTTLLADNGSVLGYAKYTDIAAYINHYPIASYNINGYTAIVAEDLQNYGFNVVWDGEARTLSVTRNEEATEIVPYGNIYRYSALAGTDSIPYIQTDIKTYVNGSFVDGFNIDGKTCIYIDSLAPYGEVAWVPEIRAIKLWIEELPMKGYEPLAEAPVTMMYAPDGRTIVVNNSEVEAYKNVGWYVNKSDVTTTLVSKDKRRIVVYNAEVEEYIKQGWTPVQSSKIDPSKPMVAVTFDDGPNPKTTNRILDSLEFYNARATFFVLGSLAEKYPDVLVRMKGLGCQIGNHTYDHPQLTNISSQKASSQLTRTSDIIANITGTRPTAIRPPYGSYNSTVSSIAGAPLILWSIDTLDWKSRNAEKVINSVLPNVKDGDIILMHDIYTSTASAAESIIPALIGKGFQLVTVDELARYKNKTLSAGSAYSQIR